MVAALGLQVQAQQQNKIQTDSEQNTDGFQTKVGKQTGRQAGRQAGGQIGRQTGRWANRQTGMQVVR